MAPTPVWGPNDDKRDTVCDARPRMRYLDET
jgi:hypothetical protein